MEHLGVDGPDVFAKDARKKQLDRREEKDADHQRGDADLESVPEDEFVGEVNYGDQQTQMPRQKPVKVASRKGISSGW